MASEEEFRKAVNGWNQAVTIIQRLHGSLQFSVAELTAISKSHPLVLPVDEGKAAQYQEAVYALDNAKSYLAAMERAR